MHGFIGTQLRPTFWGGLDEAARGALEEAVNTGGAVLTVQGMEISRAELLVIGSISEATVDGRGGGAGGRPELRPSGIGGIHTTWAALLGRRGPFGYLVLHQPIQLTRFRQMSQRQQTIQHLLR